MGQILGLDDLITQISSGNFLDFDIFKITGTAPVAAGAYHSTWLDVGMPGAGTSATVCYDNKSTNNNGGLVFPAVSPKTRYLLSIEGTSTVASELVLYDRLCSVSALNIHAAGTVTVNTPGLPLRSITTSPAASGVGVQAWLEVTTATATTALSAYITYTDSSGNSQTSVPIKAVNAAMKAGDLIGPFPYAAGGTGVSSVQNLVIVGTAPSAGVANLVLLNPVYSIPLATNIWNNRDLVLQLPSLPVISDNSCLAFMWLTTAATAANMWLKLKTVWK